MINASSQQDAPNGAVTPALFTPRLSSRREFCGPTAIAAVTGEHIDDIRAAINQHRGDIRTADGRHMPITGMTYNELLGSLRLLGWEAVEKWAAPSGKARDYRLAGFAAEHGHRGPFIVNVSGHYVAISAGEFCDTRSRLPVDLSRAMQWRGMAGRWVWNWWRFEQAQPTDDRSHFQSARLNKTYRLRRGSYEGN